MKQGHIISQQIYQQTLECGVSRKPDYATAISVWDSKRMFPVEIIEQVEIIWRKFTIWPKDTIVLKILIQNHWQDSNRVGCDWLSPGFWEGVAQDFRISVGRYWYQVRRSGAGTFKFNKVYNGVQILCRPFVMCNPPNFMTTVFGGGETCPRYCGRKKLSAFMVP